MKCELCHKNDAKVAIHVTTGGKDREFYVCRDCAEKEKSRKRPPKRRFGRLPFDEDEDDDAISRRLWEAVAGINEDEGEEKRAHRHWTLAEDVEPCPDCGTTIEDIDHSGLLGCPYCYTAFKEMLSRNVRMRGTFGGKIPHNGQTTNRPGE